MLNTTPPSARLWMPTKHSSADIAIANMPQSIERLLNVIKTNKLNRNKKHQGENDSIQTFRNFLVPLQVFPTGSCAFCHQMTNTYGANSFPWNHPAEPHPSIPDLPHKSVFQTTQIIWHVSKIPSSLTTHLRFTAYKVRQTLGLGLCCGYSGFSG